jgi:hypothetical protein
VGSFRINNIDWEVPSGVQRFTIMELMNATNGFDKAHEIGEGGFGKVFVGNFPDGRTLAIKRAAPVSLNEGAGRHQFRNEVKALCLFVLLSSDFFFFHFFQVAKIFPNTHVIP